MEKKLNEKIFREDQEHEVLKAMAEEFGSLKTYKMRAECLHDVILFLQSKRIYYFKIKKETLFPDVIITFKSSLTKKELNKILNKIEDSHVMKETLELKKDYTVKS